MIAVFLWFLFMGVTFVSFGLGALWPPLNKIATPFVCHGGTMEYLQQVSNPIPGTTITQAYWFCVDSKAGTKTVLDNMLHLYAGLIYGLVGFGLAAVIYYYYKKGVVWVQRGVGYLAVAVLALLILIPLAPLVGIFLQKPTPPPGFDSNSVSSTNATDSPVDGLFVKLTAPETSNFHSTQKALEQWKGLPVMQEATTGQEVDASTYTYRDPVDSGYLKKFYAEKMAARGWTLAGKRWQGMKFTKGTASVLVTFIPGTDMDSWIVTLTRVP